MVASKANRSYFEAFLQDSKDIESVRKVIESLKLGHSEVRQGGIEEAIEKYKEKKSPQYLIIDISNSELPVSDLNRLSEVCDPDMKLIAVGLKNDVGLYRDLKRLGVHEYLIRPLFQQILERAIKSMLFGEDTKESRGKVGKCIACIGTRGGVGSTFISTNTVSILAEERARRTVLLDLDLYFGTVSLYFNMKTNLGLTEALENPERIDKVFLERLLMPVNERLSVLSSEKALSDDLDFKLEGLDDLLEYLTSHFHYVFVDLPHSITSLTRTILEKSDMLFLTSDPTLAGLRDTGRLFRLYNSDKGGRRVIFILNKVGENPKFEVNVDNFQKALNHKVDHGIPYYPEIAMEMINKGKTLENESNPLADSLRTLVDDVLGVRGPPKEKTGLEKFLKKLKLN